MTTQEVAALIQQHQVRLRELSNGHFGRRLYSNNLACAWTADDLYQEGITRALEYAHLFKGGNFVGWMNVIFYTRACTVVQQGAKEPHDDSPYGNPLAQQPDSGLLPDEELEKKQRAIALHQAITQLPDNEAIILLYSLDVENDNGNGVGLSQELGINLNNFKQHKHRAYNRLRKLTYLNPNLS